MDESELIKGNIYYDRELGCNVKYNSRSTEIDDRTKGYYYVFEIMNYSYSHGDVETKDYYDISFIEPIENKLHRNELEVLENALYDEIKDAEDRLAYICNADGEPLEEYEDAANEQYSVIEEMYDIRVKLIALMKNKR